MKPPAKPSDDDCDGFGLAHAASAICMHAKAWNNAKNAELGWLRRRWRIEAEWWDDVAKERCQAFAKKLHRWLRARGLPIYLPLRIIERQPPPSATLLYLNPKRPDAPR